MVKSSFKNSEEKKIASFETIYFTWFVDGVLFSNLVCSAIWEGFIFMVTVNATIFLITFSQQRKARFSWAEVKSSGRGRKRPQEAFGTEPLHLPTPHPPLLPSANAGPQRGALIHPQGPPILCQCHWELRILDKEELARETTVTSLFGTMWDSLHGKAAVDLRATCSRPNNIVVGGMPSCLCGRRVSSPSTINSSCDLLKLCRFNPRHH